MHSTDEATRDTLALKRFLQDGDEEAFAELMIRYRPLVAATCQRVLSQSASHLVDDAIQTTFFMLAMRARQLRKHSYLKAWLMRAAHRAALQYLRTESRRRSREDKAAPALTPEPDVQDHHNDELASLLDEALASLSTAQREAILRFHADKASQEDIAKAMGTSVSAVKNRVARGMKKLRRFYARRGHLMSGSMLAALVTTSTPAAETPVPVSTASGLLMTQAGRAWMVAKTILAQETRRLVVSWTALLACLLTGSSLIITQAGTDLSAAEGNDQPQQSQHSQQKAAGHWRALPLDQVTSDQRNFVDNGTMSADGKHLAVLTADPANPRALKLAVVATDSGTIAAIHDYPNAAPTPEAERNSLSEAVFHLSNKLDRAVVIVDSRLLLWQLDSGTIKEVTKGTHLGNISWDGVDSKEQFAAINIIQGRHKLIFRLSNGEVLADVKHEKRIWSPPVQWHQEKLYRWYHKAGQLKQIWPTDQRGTVLQFRGGDGQALGTTGPFFGPYLISRHWLISTAGKASDTGKAWRFDTPDEFLYEPARNHQAFWMLTPSTPDSKSRWRSMWMRFGSDRIQKEVLTKELSLDQHLNPLRQAIRAADPDSKLGAATDERWSIEVDTCGLWNKGQIIGLSLTATRYAERQFKTDGIMRQITNSIGMFRILLLDRQGKLQALDLPESVGKGWVRRAQYRLKGTGRKQTKIKESSHEEPDHAAGTPSRLIRCPSTGGLFIKDNRGQQLYFIDEKHIIASYKGQ